MLLNHVILFGLLPLLSILFPISLATYEFQNLKCIAIDPSFADFEYCYIKAVNRSYKYISVKANLFKVPIKNITISFDLRKRANGYKPFLYNFTFDACKILKNLRSNNAVMTYFLSFFKYNSNFIHPCPFNHDLILEKLDASFMNERVTKMLPFPDGEYGAYTSWYAYGVLRAQVNLFAKIT